MAVSNIQSSQRLGLLNGFSCRQPHLTFSIRDGVYSAGSTTSISVSRKRSDWRHKVLGNPHAEENILSESSSSYAEGGELEELDLDDITEWELDFCSRPILDDRGKRIWELLVCDSSRRLQYAEYFPSNKINSATLKDAISGIIEKYDLQKPQKVRFFRGQMQTIISKACSELDIRPLPSLRCFALVEWLQERFSTVYSQHPNFLDSAPPLLQVEGATVQNIQDSLRGEQWAFVQLPLSGVLDELKQVKSRKMFGSTLDLEAIGLNDLPPDTMVPGVAVSSSRALPLAAWTSALELATLTVDTQRACLVLSSGISDRWRYAFYSKTAAATEEAKAWEAAKKQSGGLHFLAIQSSLESEDCDGFWLLKELSQPEF